MDTTCRVKTILGASVPVEPCLDQQHTTSCASSVPRRVQRLSETNRTVLRRHRRLKRPCESQQDQWVFDSRPRAGLVTDKSSVVVCETHCRGHFLSPAWLPSPGLWVAPPAFWSWAACLVFPPCVLGLVIPCFLVVLPFWVDLGVPPCRGPGEFKNSVSL